MRDMYKLLGEAFRGKMSFRWLMVNSQLQRSTNQRENFFSKSGLGESDIPFTSFEKHLD